MTLKSIIPSWIIVALLNYFTINSFIIGCIGGSSGYKEMLILDDLPVKNNLEKYLPALEKIVYFVNTHRHYVDVSLHFGILLVNVNLKGTLQVKGPQLSPQRRVRLERLLKTNDEIQTYFIQMVRKQIEGAGTSYDISTGLLLLSANETSWPSRLPSFNIELFKKTKFYAREQLTALYFKWPIYQKIIFDGAVSTPTTAESNICLDLLAQNPINDKAMLVHCQVPYICAQLVLNGSHFGYGMTRRLLFLLLARFSRGCTLLTYAEDKDFTDTLCATMYNEAEFIAYHNFKTVDLFLEIISLCSLEGHAQFIRRSWIEEAIDFQTTFGCFNGSRVVPDKVNPTEMIESILWQGPIAEQMMMGGRCNVHTTAVAASMLAAAIRYILENYY